MIFASPDFCTVWFVPRECIGIYIIDIVLNISYAHRLYNVRGTITSTDQLSTTLILLSKIVKNSCAV